MPQQYTFLSVDDILTPALAEALNNSSGQITAIQDTQMIAFIQWLNEQLLLASYTRHDAGGLSYMKRVYPFKTYRGSTLYLATVAGAATFQLATSVNFPVSGRCVIQSTKGSLEFVDFTNNTQAVHGTITVSTVSGAYTLQMTHSAGEKVTQLYALPSDFAKVVALKVNSFPPFEQSNNYGFPVFGEYAQYDGYLLLPYNLPNSELTLWYAKKGNTITTRTDVGSTTNIPSIASRWAIEMTLFHLFRIRRKRGDLETTQELAEKYLQDFLTYDATLDTSTLMRFQ